MDLPAHPVTASALPLSPVLEFEPKTGRIEDWNEAYNRVEDYLRAHRIRNKLHQHRLILHILHQAAERHEKDPQHPPTTLAMEETARWMTEWFQTIFQNPDIPKNRVLSQGRLSLLITDSPTRWPFLFLDAEMPETFVQSMRETNIKAGPDLQVSSMVPRPIDLGSFTNAASETFETLGQWPVFKTLFIWSVLTFVLILIFLETR
jgi:hypothetical protein